MTSNEHIITEEEAVFPFTPFLLRDELSVGTKYFVVESWKETSIQALKDCHFSQTIEWIGHKATEEEIEHFTEEDTKRNTLFAQFVADITEY
jgi:hypothetical protein